MKQTLLSLIVLGCATLASYTVSAQASPSLNVSRKDSSGVYIVKYSDMKPGKVTLTVKDEKGVLMVRKFFSSQNGFIVPINLSSLPQGMYAVQTDNGGQKASSTINYRSIISALPIYSRVMNLGDSRYLFSSSHAGKEDITIRVYDADNNVVFDEVRTVEGHFAMIFNLSSVSGQPHFEVSETSGTSIMVPGTPVVTTVPKSK